MHAPHGQLQRPLALAALVALLSAVAWFASVALLDSEESRANRPAAEASAKAVPRVVSVLPESRLSSPRATSDRKLASSERVTASGASDSELEAPLRGLVYDIRTGSGISDMQLELTWIRAKESEGVRSYSELVWTDEEGRFETRRKYRAGNFLIHRLPHRCARPWTLAEIRQNWNTNRAWGVGVNTRPFSFEPSITIHDPARPTRHALTLESGPVYRIDTNLPAGTTVCDFEASLSAESSLGTGEDLSHGAASTSTALREGEPFAARFPTSIQPGARGPFPPWILTLSSHDGSWVGSAAVQSIVGECQDLVVIELQARGGLRGRVLTPSAKPEPDARISVAPALAPRFHDYSEAETTDDDGRFRFLGLPPGRHAMLVEAEGFAAVEREVVVLPFAVQTLDVRLAPSEAGEVRGWLRFGAGKTYGVPQLVLYRSGPLREQEREARIFNVKDGRAEFLFEKVPAGEYELELHPMGNRVWTPTKQRIRAPATEIEIVRGEEELATLLVDARGAEDDAPVAAFSVWIEDRAGRRLELGQDGNAIVRRISPREELAITISAPGRQLARTVLPARREPAAFRIAELRLPPGWGAAVLALDADSGEPLEGARILVDGEERALTDASGQAFVSSSNIPRRLDVQLAGADCIDDDLTSGRRPLADPGGPIAFRLRVGE